MVRLVGFENIYNTQGAEAALAHVGILGTADTLNGRVYTITDDTKRLFQAYLNSDVRVDGEGVVYTLAKQMAIEDLGGTEKFDKLSMREKQEAIGKWTDWMSDNLDIVRYTNLDLGRFENDTLIIDNLWKASEDEDIILDKDSIIAYGGDTTSSAKHP